MAIARILATTTQEEDALQRALLEEQRRLHRLRARKVVDGRTRLGRRLRELEERYTEEVTKARGTISAWDQTLIRRIATVTIAVEQMENEMLSGEPIQKSELGRMSNTLRHLIRDLKLGEQALTRIDEADDDGPSIEEIAKRHKQKETAE